MEDITIHGSPNCGPSECIMLPAATIIIYVSTIKTQ